MRRFRDRSEAGVLLAERLQAYADREDVTVLGLPRGGIVVAYEVAQALDAPLDVLVVRKLGVPGQEELAMGAIASGGVRVLNEEVVRALAMPQATIESVTQAAERELRRREKEYRGDRPPRDLRGRTVIIVDDGLATGATMRAAVAAVGAREPAEIVVAVPVGAPETCRGFAQHGHEVVCAEMPEPFYAVGLWYEDFSQTSDAEVRRLLAPTAGG